MPSAFRLVDLRRRVQHLAVLGLCAAALAACAAQQQMASTTPPPAPPAPKLEVFEATAYSIEGKTASGARTREGICAADPTILPLGSRIHVHEAGEYSGEYLVSDTGRTIKGREIDIYLASDGEAKRFGRQQVRVEILSLARR